MRWCATWSPMMTPALVTPGSTTWSPTPTRTCRQGLVAGCGWRSAWRLRSTSLAMPSWRRSSGSAAAWVPTAAAALWPGLRRSIGAHALRCWVTAWWPWCGYEPLAGRPATQGLGTGSWSLDAEQGERAGTGPVATRPAHPAGDIVVPAQPQQADRQVSQGRHHLGAVPRADLRAVLVEAHIAHPVRPVLDLPLAAGQHPQPGGAGPGSVQTGDGLGDLGARVATGKVGGVALDDQHLLGVGEPRPGWHRGGVDPAMLDASVAAVNGLVHRGKTPPGAGG